MVKGGKMIEWLRVGKRGNGGKRGQGLRVGKGVRVRGGKQG
jgi:hypothetical protein